MSFDKRDNAKTYTPQDGDTLQTIADRETAAGNELTWQEIAKFNWGTDDADEVNEYMRDELGCYERDESNNFVVSSDGDSRSDLLIPVPFEQSGFALRTTHTLRIRKQESPQQFLECSSIPGVTFEFDKSFVRPSVVDNIGELEERIERYPDAKIMIFGHTDKSGSDSYNKALSERRAKSIYAFITDDPDTWESLYNQENWGMRVLQQILQDFGDPYDPGRTDGVQDARTTQAIRQYQEDRGLTADGVAGPITRREMFTEYMTDKHDVELTPDQFMDPKHMGCGEFNPIDQVDGSHEPNRRVTFYLFDEARLPNLPCREGNLSPCQKQMMPPIPRYKTSFRCSFYDSLARKCPCEVGPVEPPPATIEIIDAALAVATSVKIGLWDNAFNAAGTVLNNVAEADNFVGADTRRFHFRVRDPAATGDHVDIDWKTLGSTRGDLDIVSATPNLTLVETPSGSKTFVSRGVMLTCDLHDVKQATNSGLASPLPDPGDRSHGQTNHRTRTARMDGFVKGEYTPASGAPAVSVELPVFERTPDERRRLPLQFYVLRVAAGGAGVVPTAAGSVLWTTDIRVIKESYERIGIKTETVVAPGTPAGDIVTVDGLSIVLIDAPAGVNPLNVTLANETTMGTAFPMVGHTVRVFITGGLASGNRGEAAPDVDFAGTPDQGTAFINGATKGPYTVAHEIGHMLANKSASGGHYNVPTAPAGHRFFNNQNLLRNGTSVAEGVNQSKRMWDTNDADGVNQYTASLSSPYTRAF